MPNSQRRQEGSLTQSRGHGGVLADKGADTFPGEGKRASCGALGVDLAGCFPNATLCAGGCGYFCGQALLLFRSNQSPSPCQLQNEQISTQKLPQSPTQGAAAPAATALGEVSVACRPRPPTTCPFSLLSQVSGQLLVTLVIYTQTQLLHVQLKLQP